MKESANYIISYDISDHKRLAKLARYLEKEALRIQFSIFYAQDVNQIDLFELIETINSIIDPEDDDVRIYTVVNVGNAIGEAYDLENPLLFV